MSLQIDTGRLVQELDTLATMSDDLAPAVTRIVFSETDLRARAYLKQLGHAAKLTIREDAVGNIFLRWWGKDPDAPAIGTGSHTDAIPHAGRFDGTVGVLGGLEAIRALQSSGFEPQRSIELLMFTSEEPTRFGIGCLGSRLLCGSLDASADDRLKDRNGECLRELRTTAGLGGDLDTVRLPRDYYAGFVELHIEQGPILEREGIHIGAVTAIAAPASLRLRIEGEGGHAGAMLMAQRHDAFLAAAEIALAAERAAKSSGSIDTVATAGVCELFPSAINSVPSRTKLELDVRDIDLARRDKVLEQIDEACREVAHRRGVSIHQELINADAPCTCDPAIVDAVAAAATKHSLSLRRMVSRAYHDSLFMSRVTPTAMIFIPCRGGVSHRPDEYSSPEALEHGALVLAETLAALAQ